jgi:hypothetical protein
MYSRIQYPGTGRVWDLHLSSSFMNGTDLFVHFIAKPHLKYCSVELDNVGTVIGVHDHLQVH